MSKYLVKTETGSTYRILEDTWERVGESDLSGNIRTPGGTILNKDSLEIEVGKSMVIQTENINPLADARVIVTSPVVSVESLY